MHRVRTLLNSRCAQNFKAAFFVAIVAVVDFFFSHLHKLFYYLLYFLCRLLLPVNGVYLRSYLLKLLSQRLKPCCWSGQQQKNKNK